MSGRHAAGPARTAPDLVLAGCALADLAEALGLSFDDITRMAVAPSGRRPGEVEIVVDLASDRVFRRGFVVPLAAVTR